MQELIIQTIYLLHDYVAHVYIYTHGYDNIIIYSNVQKNRIIMNPYKVDCIGIIQNTIHIYTYSLM